LRRCRNILLNGASEALQRDMIEKAATGKAVSIDIGKMNPAMRLYLRPGFLLEEDKGASGLTRRTPEHAGAAPPGRRDER
jgi:hypothetical protein